MTRLLLPALAGIASGGCRLAGAVGRGTRYRECRKTEMYNCSDVFHGIHHAMV
jgi:hypothetical protein